MHHYEVVFMVNHEQGEQVPLLIERCTSLIKASGGHIHRLEDWGRRLLAYPIKKMNRAYYVLLNIEATKEAVAELENLFRYNEWVIRSLVMHVKQAVVQASSMAKLREERQERREHEHQPLEEQVIEAQHGHTAGG